MKVGLIGDPVAHSLSPAMQQAALDALGVAARYELWRTPAADLAGRVASLRRDGVLGANVTVPHKLAVMGYLDEVTPLARRAGAVNTIVVRDRRLVGDNTDVYGFGMALSEVWGGLGGRFDGGEGTASGVPKGGALVLGAGGAARAVVLALEGTGVAEITVANRDPDRARRLAADLAPTAMRVAPFDVDSLGQELRQAALVVNATAVGWHPGEAPMPLGLLAGLPDGALVVDLTYRETDLLVAARGRGLGTLDGLPMLVYQGARALELWTGRAAPVGVMMEAARRARAGMA